MNRLIQHFLLIFLLILHVSWGSVMAAQMQTFHLNTDTQEVATSSNTVVMIDQSADDPCPHHSMNGANSSQQEPQSMSSCECSNCNCVNVMSSLVFPIESLGNLHLEASHDSAFIISVFPDSPPAFILRPPIS